MVQFYIELKAGNACFMNRVFIYINNCIGTLLQHQVVTNLLRQKKRTIPGITRFSMCLVFCLIFRFDYQRYIK
jgi:hypothetical protein